MVNIYPTKMGILLDGALLAIKTIPIQPEGAGFIV